MGVVEIVDIAKAFLVLVRIFGFIALVRRIPVGLLLSWIKKDCMSVDMTLYAICGTVVL